MPAMPQQNAPAPCIPARITMLSADSRPCGDPTLSKGYLSGAAPAESVPLRSNRLLCRAPHRREELNARVSAINTAESTLQLVDSSKPRIRRAAPLPLTPSRSGSRCPRRGSLPHVHYLRAHLSADGHALVAKALESKRAVIISCEFHWAPGWPRRFAHGISP
jgi:hypothetical protein